MTMKKFRNILIGWGKRLGILQTSPAEQKMSKARMYICGKCPEAKQSQVLELINGNAEMVDCSFCTLCKCPCLEKTLVIEESCPMGKW